MKCGATIREDEMKKLNVEYIHMFRVLLRGMAAKRTCE